MEKELKYNNEIIEINNYKTSDNFLNNKNDITLYSIYDFIKDLEKITDFIYDIKITYYGIKEEYFEMKEDILRKIDVTISIGERESKTVAILHNIFKNMQENKGKLPFKAYDNDFININISNNGGILCKNYDKKQIFSEYEYKSNKLMEIYKTNHGLETIKFLIEEEIDKITDKVYKTNMTQILNQFYKMIDSEKIEKIDIDPVNTFNIKWEE